MSSIYVCIYVNIVTHVRRIDNCNSDIKQYIFCGTDWPILCTRIVVKAIHCTTVCVAITKQTVQMLQIILLYRSIVEWNNKLETTIVMSFRVVSIAKWSIDKNLQLEFSLIVIAAMTRCLVSCCYCCCCICRLADKGGACSTKAVLYSDREPSTALLQERGHSTTCHWSHPPQLVGGTQSTA